MRGNKYVCINVSFTHRHLQFNHAFVGTPFAALKELTIRLTSGMRLASIEAHTHCQEHQGLLHWPGLQGDWERSQVTVYLNPY